MYLYLGQNTVVPKSGVVAICDMDNTTESKITVDWLKRAQQSGQIVSVSQELPKSFVVCCQDGRTTVYLSQLTPATLAKRWDTGVEEIEISK